MKLFGINIIEHPDFTPDEAWIIFKKDAPQVPQDLRNILIFPCILTGDMEQTTRMLNLLQAIAVPHTSDTFTQPTTVLALLDDSHPFSSLQKALSC